MKRFILGVILLAASVCGSFQPALAQGGDDLYTFSGDMAIVTKYLWRGQRLTNDWSVQPSMTIGVGKFSFNAWGTLDLTKVNEGSVGRLFIPENPIAPEGAKGLRYRFSEIDYTFSYSPSIGPVSIDAGTIFYTFPDRSELIPWTIEFYGSATLSEVPLSPSATFYVDIDESRKLDHGGPSLYVLLTGGDSIPFNNATFPGLDLSGTVSLVNGGFGYLYYRDRQAGAHDASFTIGLPINIGQQWSAGAFVTYSALLGKYRAHQFPDPRHVHTGTAGGPGSYADTVWGGFNVSLGF